MTVCHDCGFRQATWEAEHEETAYIPTAPDEPVTMETTYSIIPVCAACAHNHEKKRQMKA